MRKKLFVLTPSIGVIIFLTIFVTLSFSKKWVLLGDSDTGWHIRVGEFILDNFSIPSYDIYSYVAPPLPWTNPDWLSEVIMALLHRNFGLTGVVIFYALLISLIYYLLFKIIRQCDGNIITDALIVLIAVASSMVYWHARPFLFSIMLFLLSYYVLDKFQYNEKNYLYFLPPIILFWANLHGGFLIGLTLIVTYLFCNFITFLTFQANRKDEFKKKTTILALTTLLCILVSLINPYGYHIYVYAFKVLTNKYLMDNSLEFLSPNFHEFYTAPFRYLLLLVILALAVTRERLKLIELTLILMFTNMALYSGRYILLFSIVVAPILSRYFKLIFAHLKGNFISFIEERSQNISKIDASANGYLWMIPLVAILFIAGIRSGRLEYKFNEMEKPVAATEFLLKERLRGNMFNSYWFGGYIIYAAYPQYKVFIHGKIDWHGEEKLKEYLRVEHLESGWEDVLNKYKVKWIIFDKDSLLSRGLKEKNEWLLIYTDKVADIFVRNVPECSDIIKKYRQPLSPAS